MPKLSERMKTKLYASISDPVMDLRLQIKRSEPISKDKMDDFLFALEQQIWKEVKATLNLARGAT